MIHTFSQANNMHVNHQRIGGKRCRNDVKYRRNTVMPDGNKDAD